MTGPAREGKRQRSRTLSPLEASDREQELAGWLEDTNVANGWEVAPELVRFGIMTEDLERLAGAVPADSFAPAISWLHKSIDAQDLADTVMRSTKSISELVGIVKSYSYMDRAPIQRIDIHDGLDDTLTILHHKLKRGVEVLLDYDRTLPRFQARGSELNQVWTNLIDNAVDAMEGNGTLSIRTYAAGDEIVVEIADTGPGIPDDIQAQIFDPFFTTKAVGEGTGLGLDVVRRVVTERCGGSIDLRSQAGETVFTVTLPTEEKCDYERSQVAEIDAAEE